MAISRDSRRRWLGAIFIGLALLLLILGQTVLADSLHGAKYILYWLGCFVFTGLAALVAMIDFFVLRRRVRQQQREFIEAALQAVVEKQKQSRHDK